MADVVALLELEDGKDGKDGEEVVVVTTRKDVMLGPEGGAQDWSKMELREGEGGGETRETTLSGVDRFESSWEEEEEWSLKKMDPGRNGEGEGWYVMAKEGEWGGVGDECVKVKKEREEDRGCGGVCDMKTNVGWVGSRAELCASESNNNNKQRQERIRRGAKRRGRERESASASAKCECE
jgi:hypothetical protein